MRKDLEDILKEPARIKAERKWRNHDVEKRFKETVMKAGSAPKAPKELEIGDVIENDKIIEGRVIRAQTKFANEIRAMLDEHKRRNLATYVILLQRERKRKLYMKIKLLEAKIAQRDQEKSNV